MVAVKPLGRKAYGSIPHLPTSRLGPGDYACHEGQARIACEKARDKHDRIIVTEKLDGSNVSVANVDGAIMAIGRAGYLCQASPYRQHQIFAAWVRQREGQFLRALEPGERIVGEWIYQAHGTLYRTADPFVAFDVMVGGDRLSHDEARARFSAAGVAGAYVISDGPPVSVDSALAALGPGGFHGAEDLVEGAVWRVERKGKFDFLAKFVRHDKVDGKYLPGCQGNPDDHPERVLFPDLLALAAEVAE